MSSTEQQISGLKQDYLTKKVKVNGQLVTLYSLNGQTWLSSPEEIPEVMARLESARVTLNDGAKEGKEAKEAKEGAEAPPAKDAKPPEKVASPLAAPTSLASKYRMKGPKPRPILKQNGMVFKGTPVEPFSASAVQVATEKAVEAKGAKSDRPKLKAPVRAQAKGAAAPAGKKIKVAAGKASPKPVKVASPQKAPSKPLPPQKSKAAPRIVKGPAKKVQPPAKKGSVPKAKAKPLPASKKGKPAAKRAAR